MLSYPDAGCARTSNEKLLKIVRCPGNSQFAIDFVNFQKYAAEWQWLHKAMEN